MVVRQEQDSEAQQMAEQNLNMLNNCNWEKTSLCTPENQKFQLGTTGAF